MTVDWDSYVIYHPSVMGPLHELPRREARGAFNRLMEARPVRTEMLRRLLEANGFQLGTTDDAVQDLNDWFRVNVEEDPVKPGRLLPEWYSVVNDIALFLGDQLVARRPGLAWTFYTWGKTDLSYQRHVIMGFDEIPNPRYNVDIDGLVATYAHRIVQGQEVPHDQFLQWLRIVDYYRSSDLFT